MSDLNRFFREERNRVFEPGPYFTERVMARLLSTVPAPAGIWDCVHTAVRPVFAVALMVLFAVLAVKIMAPVEPTRGPIEAFMAQDLTPRERMLFIDAQAPATTSQFEELMLLDPAQ
jgi:hypothetical protein